MAKSQGELAYNAYNDYLYDVGDGTDEDDGAYPAFEYLSKTQKEAWEKVAEALKPAPPELTDRERGKLILARQILDVPIYFLGDDVRAAQFLVKLADAAGVPHDG